MFGIGRKRRKAMEAAIKAQGSIATMMVGKDGMYMKELMDALHHPYIPPVGDLAQEAIPHLQKGVLVRFKNGLVYTVTESGAIHFAPGNAGWIRTEALHRKVGEIQSIEVRTPQGMNVVWGEQVRLPLDEEIQ